MSLDIRALSESVRALKIVDLKALVLFGSRGRGDAHEGSDWDFGFLGTPELDLLDLSARLSDLVRSDAVDVVDLDRASGLLRIRAAREGQVLWESEPGVWQTFQEQAARFWCDAEPVLRSAYEQVLSR